MSACSTSKTTLTKEFFMDAEDHVGLANGVCSPRTTQGCSADGRSTLTSRSHDSSQQLILANFTVPSPLRDGGR